tara:strand:+ start:343 stop:516 length:174 start_codon:yes stop_codon:yes gene_type:complete
MIKDMKLIIAKTLKIVNVLMNITTLNYIVLMEKWIYNNLILLYKYLLTNKSLVLFIH